MILLLTRYKIAETYIRLDLQFNEANQTSIRNALRKAVEKEVEQFKYEKGLVYVVIVEKGSIKGKVVLYGTMIFFGISNYGSFRQGINQIYDDVRTVSENIIDFTKKNENQVNDQTIIRIERRTGIVGKLKRTIDRINELQIGLNNLSNSETSQELSRLKQDLANILDLLSVKDKQAIIMELPRIITRDLPRPNEDEKLTLYNKYGLKPKDFEIEKKNASGRKKGI